FCEILSPPCTTVPPCGFSSAEAAAHALSTKVPPSRTLGMNDMTVLTISASPLSIKPPLLVGVAFEATQGVPKVPSRCKSVRLIIAHKMTRSHFEISERGSPHNAQLIAAPTR